MRLRGQLSSAERDKLSRYSLRLFASVDLEDSTAFKQNHANRDGRVWLRVLLDFVEKFDQMFWAHVGKAARDARHAMPARPQLWKILGDELVFSVEITRARETAIYVDALAAALAEWNAGVLAGLKAALSPATNRPLRIKGAMWLADFPITNAVLPVAGTHHDFVGPAMDAGFRLGKLASPRRLALSVDLVWLLLTQDETRKIEFAGRTRDLKGLAADSGYPHLWIEVAASAYYAHEQQVLSSRRPPIPGVELRTLCKLFIDDFGVPPHTPHLPAEPDNYPPPPRFADALLAAQEELTLRCPDTGKKTQSTKRAKEAASRADLAAQAANPPAPARPSEP
jgi:hypothetical protein